MQTLFKPFFVFFLFTLSFIARDAYCETSYSLTQKNHLKASKKCLDLFFREKRIDKNNVNYINDINNSASNNGAGSFHIRFPAPNSIKDKSFLFNYEFSEVNDHFQCQFEQLEETPSSLDLENQKIELWNNNYKKITQRIIGFYKNKYKSSITIEHIQVGMYQVYFEVSLGNQKLRFITTYDLYKYKTLPL